MISFISNNVSFHKTTMPKALHNFSWINNDCKTSKIKTKESNGFSSPGWNHIEFALDLKFDGLKNMLIFVFYQRIDSQVGMKKNCKMLYCSF